MRRPWLAVLAVVAVTLGAGGCGIPLDDGPRPLQAGEEPDLPSATDPPAPAGGSSSPKVYFINGQRTDGSERLLGASRDVAPQPTAVLSELLKGLTPEERDRRLQTSIPAETRLLDTNLLPDGTLEVDVNDAFFQAKGDAQAKAVAQIVYTATSLRQVKRVRLLVEGQPRDWPRGDGVVVSTPLTPFDYPQLNPSSQPDYPPALLGPQPSTTAA